MIGQTNLDTLLRRVDALSREIERLRRDLLHGVADQPAVPARKRSLFGSVRAGDITSAMIEDAKQDLFRSPDDLWIPRDRP